jgi:hypothetical protein
MIKTFSNTYCISRKGLVIYSIIIVIKLKWSYVLILRLMKPRVYSGHLQSHSIIRWVKWYIKLSRLYNKLPIYHNMGIFKLYDTLVVFSDDGYTMGTLSGRDVDRRVGIQKSMYHVPNTKNRHYTPCIWSYLSIYKRFCTSNISLGPIGGLSLSCDGFQFFDRRGAFAPKGAKSSCTQVRNRFSVVWNIGPTFYCGQIAFSKLPKLILTDSYLLISVKWSPRGFQKRSRPLTRWV